MYTLLNLTTYLFIFLKKELTFSEKLRTVLFPLNSVEKRPNPGYFDPSFRQKQRKHLKTDAKI